MPGQDWLSLSAIARYWGEETGRNAEEIERDLEAWFSEFVEREHLAQPEASDAGPDTTNRLMGLLGGQYLQRETLAIYCEETGHAMPKFWVAQDGRDAAPEPPSPSVPWAESDVRNGTVEARRIDDEADIWESAAFRPEPAEPPAGDREPAAPAPAAEVAPARPAGFDVSPPAMAWPPPSRAAPRRRTPVLLAAGLALALASLGGGYLLGQGAASAPQTAPQTAPGTATAGQAAETVALRNDLDQARQKIAILAAALDRSEKEKAGLAAELHKRRRALDGAAERPDATEADARVAALTSELAAARAKIASLTKAATARDGEAVKRRLIETATAASAEAMSFKAELDDARQRIGTLELEAQTAKAEAHSLAAELTAFRQQRQTAPHDARDGEKSTRQRLILAAEIASTQAALAKRDLDEALKRLTRFESEAETAEAEAAALADELAETRRQHAQATKDAEVAAATARQELFLKAQSASSHAARLDQEVDIAREQIVDLEAQLGAAKAEAAGLAERLAELRQDHEAALQRERSDALAEQRDSLATTDAARAESAARQRELDAARQRIAELEAELGAAAAPSAPQRTDEAAAPTDGAAQPSPPLELGTRQTGQPIVVLGRPHEAAAAADEGADGIGSERETLSPSSRQDGAQTAAARASGPAEPVNVDSLVTDPGRYDARRVTVSGSLLRLLEHYRLQSRSGLRTLVVEVANIAPAQRENLQQAIAKAGLIGSVRTRIDGRVERLSANAFRLVADDITVLE